MRAIGPDGWPECTDQLSIHVAVPDGVFTFTRDDAPATFHPLPSPDRTEIQDIASDVAIRTFTWLRRRDRERREGLLRYCARAPLSLERLRVLPDGRVAYFFGNDPCARAGIRPYLAIGAGVAEVQSRLTVDFYTDAAAYNQGRRQSPQAWRTAGRGFVSPSFGSQFAFGRSTALSLELRIMPARHERARHERARPRRQHRVRTGLVGRDGMGAEPFNRSNE